MSSPLAARLSRLEALLMPDDDYPALAVVFADSDTWSTSDGAVIDKATIDARTRVLVFSERPDGPQ